MADTVLINNGFAAGEIKMLSSGELLQQRIIRWQINLELFSATNGIDNIVINELPSCPNHVAELAGIARLGLLLRNDVADFAGTFAL